MTDQMQLIIPATEPMMLVARMALAGFCCQCGADIDTLDDIRTLSDEACYCLIHQPHAVNALKITANRTESHVRVRFEAQARGGALCGRTQYDLEVARGILESMASSVWVAQKDGELYEIELDVHIAPL